MTGRILEGVVVKNDGFAGLREPFPHVERVTKTWKDRATGQPRSVTLDYIGHGVVTDRLLAVDPTYTFEPLLDSNGFPIVATQGLAEGDTVAVWGRLTILGVSCVEVSSGKTLLDAYSRCLCRAAMRRGVALDLWIKDDSLSTTAASDGEVRKSAPDPIRPAAGEAANTAPVTVPGEGGNSPAVASPNPVARAQAAQQANSPGPGDTVVPFGKHKGKTLAQAGEGYARWVAEKFEAKTTEQELFVDACRRFVGLEPVGAGAYIPADVQDIPF